MHFTSDNAIPAAPEIMQAIMDCNTGGTGGYGSDPYCDEAIAKIREIFEAPEAAVYFVTTGSAANALALATLVEPFECVFCHTEAHINTDECGAPEFFTNGAKLVGIHGADGKLHPDELKNVIKATGTLGVHNVQRGAVSLTNLTEAGTSYSVAELTALCDIAKSFNRPVHLDGARFANVIASGNHSPADHSWRAGVDVVVLGGTKNGLMMGEAVVIFDPKKAWEFELRRKRGGHLVSKGRYLGAQFSAFLNDDLWLTYARHANAQMAKLYAGLKSKTDVEFDFTPAGNVAFIRFPRALHQDLHAAGAKYYLFPADQSLEGQPEEVLSARLVTSWCTTDEELEHFMSFF